MSKKTKKIIGIVLSVAVLALSFCFSALASNTPATSPADMDVDQAVSAASTLFNKVAGTLNFASVAKVLSIGIGAAIGIYLAWWGLRKLVRMLTRVLERGKLSL